MNNLDKVSDYKRVEQVISYLSKNYEKKPDLDVIAKEVGLSVPHMHRLFKRWAGLTPKQFMQFITKENIKKTLSDSQNLLEASYASKLSSQSRLYDLFVTYEAVTPGEYRSAGENLLIEYGIHHTQFGDCLIGITDKGICHLSFITDKDEDFYIYELKDRWENASFRENQKLSADYIEKIFNKKKKSKSKPFHLLLKGTNFQIKVWEALMNIPEGCLVTYKDIAKHMNHPRAVRAVASAVANNSIGYLIPCHRVIKNNGAFHNYRWGNERKIAINFSECG